MPLTTSTVASPSSMLSPPLSHPPSLHLLDRPDNIFYHYNDSDSDIDIVYFGISVLHPFYRFFAHLFTAQNFSILPMNNSPLSSLSPAPLATSPPKSSRTPARKNLWTLVDKYDRFHTHTQTKRRLIALFLCTTIITYVPLYGYSPFRADNATALAQQNTDPEIEFQSSYSNLISDEAKSFVRRLAALNLLHCRTQRFYVTLSYPHPTITTTTTPRRPLPRRHNWSRAKWYSALTGIRAANNLSYFAATAAASGSSTQSSDGWNRQDPSPRVVTQALSKEEEKDDLGRGDNMPGSFEPAHQEPSLPWTEVVGKN